MVFNGKICLPLTLTIGVMAGMVGSRYSRKTEKVAPVSRRKEMGRPSTVKVTLGSCLVMEMVGREAPGPHQSSSASPTTAGLGWGLFVQPPLLGGWAIRPPVALFVASGAWGGRRSGGGARP